MVNFSIQKIYHSINSKIPVRFNVGIMLFMGCLLCYMLRVNMSISLLAMVEAKPSSNESQTEILPDYGPRYPWDVNDQSLMLGAYFWGYLVTSLPGGVLAEQFGGTQVGGIVLGISAVLTALCPLAATGGFWYLWTLRFFIGVAAGPLFPALHYLVSRWAPPEEKGKFVATLLGGTFGTVITWPIVGIVTEKVGWNWGFYIPAIITGLCTLVWYLLMADSPSQHTRISLAEREYIENSLGGNISRKKAFPPIMKVMTSIPFWGLLILHYGNLWGLYFLMTAAPKFMNEILGFNLSKAGFLSSLPYLARLIFGFIFGSIGDFIRKRGIMSVTMIRKSFTIFSHVIPGLFLLAMMIAEYHPYVCVAIITMSLGFNGSSTITNLQNSQDLAPNFAGSLYGTINFVGTTTGFISPLVVAAFTQTENTMQEWRLIFMVGAIAYIAPAILFVFIGSGNVQKWNEIKKSDDEDTENKIKEDEH